MQIENKMTDNFCGTKKLMQGLGFPVEKIDYCKNGCMLYWREENGLINCNFFNHPRFKRSKHQRSKKRTNIYYKKISYFPFNSTSRKVVCI